MAHEYGASPPMAASELVYGTPMVPTLKAAVVIDGGADNVATIPPKLLPEPTMTQLAGPAHEAPSNEATAGGAL